MKFEINLYNIVEMSAIDESNILSKSDDENNFDTKSVFAASKNISPRVNLSVNIPVRVDPKKEKKDKYSAKKEKKNKIKEAKLLRKEKKPMRTVSKQSPEEAQRSAAFERLNNKVDLTRTRACSNVTPKEGSEDYGTCDRAMCSFAHSLEELKDPMCSFDSSCRTIKGKRTETGIDTSKTCMFRHSFESRDEWTTRTGKTLPNLPRTSEQSRKPKEYTPRSSKNEESDTESDYQHPPSPLYEKKEKKEKALSSIIRVPTKELAEIALKAAFEQGVFNITIIIE